jgi:hypothetical protein
MIVVDFALFYIVIAPQELSLCSIFLCFKIVFACFIDVLDGWKGFGVNDWKISVLFSAR